MGVEKELHVINRGGKQGFWAEDSTMRWGYAAQNCLNEYICLVFELWRTVILFVWCCASSSLVFATKNRCVRTVIFIEEHVFVNKKKSPCGSFKYKKLSFMKFKVKKSLELKNLSLKNILMLQQTS